MSNATKTETFEVGDRVRILATDWTGVGDEAIGKLGTVMGTRYTYDEETWPVVKVDGGIGNLDCGNTFRAEQVEKVAAFEAGDIAYGKVQGDIAQGFVVTIVGEAPSWSSTAYEVNMPSGERGVYFEDELTLIGGQRFEFQVGDVVDVAEYAPVYECGTDCVSSSAGKRATVIGVNADDDGSYVRVDAEGDPNWSATPERSYLTLVKREGYIDRTKSTAVAEVEEDLAEPEAPDLAGFVDAIQEDIEYHIRRSAASRDEKEERRANEDAEALRNVLKTLAFQVSSANNGGVIVVGSQGDAFEVVATRIAGGDL